MNATTTAPVARTSPHSDCSHPATKVARAQCRKARKAGAPKPLTRAAAKIGQHVRNGDYTGSLVGWGAKRITLGKLGPQDGPKVRHFDATSSEVFPA